MSIYDPPLHASNEEEQVSFSFTPPTSFFTVPWKHLTYLTWPKTSTGPGLIQLWHPPPVTSVYAWNFYLHPVLSHDTRPDTRPRGPPGTPCLFLSVNPSTQHITQTWSLPHPSFYEEVRKGVFFCVPNLCTLTWTLSILFQPTNSRIQLQRDTIVTQFPTVLSRGREEVDVPLSSP